MTLASKAFSVDDQNHFSILSGDYNPIHVDAIRARRTVTGYCVVHGVHLLLWALDALIEQDRSLPLIDGIRVRFSRFTYLGETIDAVVTQRTKAGIQIELASAGVTRCSIKLSFGNHPKYGLLDLPIGPVFALDPEPIDNSQRSIDDKVGQIAFIGTERAITERFPAVARWLGGRRLEALAAATRLAGMVYPGLYSILGGLDLSLCDVPVNSALSFRMGSLRHGFIEAYVQGGGLVGRIECLSPNPPVIQPSAIDIRDTVAKNAFLGSTALVIGGSRGLGEVIAKILAAGNANVIITYRDGRDDASAVAQEIVSAGGQCTIMRYCAEEPSEGQLVQLPQVPTHAYYCATPMISRPNSIFYSRGRFQELEAIYVDGFWRLAMKLHARRAGIVIGYPSVDAVLQIPDNLTEYAMAKVAGEALCAGLNATIVPTRIAVVPLPWMLTDQTARVPLFEFAPIRDTALKLIRKVQGGSE